MADKLTRSAILGATFLMATSAIGPGFLTQTAKFSKEIGASLGFIILVSALLDIAAQLNIWRILTSTEKRAQDLANETIYGSGFLLAALVSFGGLVFNIGNIGGCGLGLNAALGIDAKQGAGLSAAFATGIFLSKSAGKVMDVVVKVLGAVLILLTVYIVFAAHPPVADIAFRTFLPDKFDAKALITLVGGTVGGYITFAGGHRLIDAGIVGSDKMSEVNCGAVNGILITSLMRFLLFFAAFGVVAAGFAVDMTNPAASVFQSAAGNIGLRFFGVVMWAAAITSVIGAAFTSISFLKTLFSAVEKNERLSIILFIAISSIIFVFLGNPVDLLVWAGTVNGFILPFGLAVILYAAWKKRLKHPVYLYVAGAAVVLIMTFFSVKALADILMK